MSREKESSFKTKKYKNIVHYVTMQYMKNNRKRTATTFAGIVLMVLLMTCVFVGRDTGIGYLEDVASIKKGKYHAAMYGVTKETYEAVSKLPYVIQTAGSVQFGSTVFHVSENKERPFLNVKGYTSDCYDWMNISLHSGRLPQNDKEIVISKSAVDDGAQIKPGDQVEADFFERSLTGTSQDGGTTYFPFSGLSVKSGQTADVPENFPFYEENDSFRENHDYTGEKRLFTVTGIIETPAYESSSAAGYTALTTLTADQIMALPKFNMSMIFDQKILPHDWYQELENQFPACEIEVNDQVLAFSANSSDTTMNLVVQYMTVLFTVLIMAVSVVLICNVFQMSFQERSRYLGMLCSVGATGRQKRSSIYYEAFYLLLFALPLGIVLGITVIWTAMTFFRPMLLEFMNLGYGVEAIPVRIRISMKNLAAVAAMSSLTVLLSAFLPARKIGRIGPIESIRGNTERRSRTHRTSVRVIRLSGAEGLLAWSTLTRSSHRVRAVSRAASVFLVLLTVTAFGAASLHQVMEKKLVSSGFTADQESYDYALYASGEAVASGAYEALKEEIKKDAGVENVREWYSAMFVGEVSASVYSDAYWDAAYDIMNAYHHGTLCRKEFEKEWRLETRAVNMLSVDDRTFREMAEVCGADTDTLSDYSAIVLGEGEFSTDNVGVMGMEPNRYRYYHLDNMTSLKTGDDFSVSFYSDQEEQYINRRFSVAACASAHQLEEYLSGAGDYYFWIITGPQAGADVTAITADAQGIPYLTPELQIGLSEKKTDLLSRLSQLTEDEDGPFHLAKAGYVQSLESTVITLADCLLLSFVILASLICLLNLFNSVRGWIQESAQDYTMLWSVGATGVQLKKMLLLQCGGIFLRVMFQAVFGAGILIAAIRFGMITIFGSLRLEIPLALFILSALVTGGILAALSIERLKKVRHESR